MPGAKTSADGHEARKKGLLWRRGRSAEADRLDGYLRIKWASGQELALDDALADGFDAALRSGRGRCSSLWDRRGRLGRAQGGQAVLVVHAVRQRWRWHRWRRKQCVGWQVQQNRRCNRWGCVRGRRIGSGHSLGRRERLAVSRVLPLAERRELLCSASSPPVPRRSWARFGQEHTPGVGVAPTAVAPVDQP